MAPKVRWASRRGTRVVSRAVTISVASAVLASGLLVAWMRPSVAKPRVTASFASVTRRSNCSVAEIPNWALA